MDYEKQNNFGAENSNERQNRDEIRDEILKMAANARLAAEKKSAQTDSVRAAAESDAEPQAEDRAFKEKAEPQADEGGKETAESGSKNKGESNVENKDENTADEPPKSAADIKPLFIDEQEILEILSNPKSKKSAKIKKEKKSAANKDLQKAAGFEGYAESNAEAALKSTDEPALKAAKKAGEAPAEQDGESHRKKPLIKRIFCYLFPVKGDPTKEIIRKIIFLLALVTFLGAAGYLINYYSQGYVNENRVSKARAVYSAGSTELNKDGMMIRFEELYRQNPDIIGWIRIDGTKIDYPVYKTDNNDYYIDHDMSRNSSRYGAIFADMDAQIEKDGTGQNTVLYGHNMIDGSMFTGLLKYKELKFYRENPVINFDTLYAAGQYKVFAVIITNVNADDDNGYVFNYRLPSFSSEIAFENWITNVKARSIIDTGIDVADGDEILTLSTCSYEFDDARTVVFARRVRADESRYIDTTKAKTNKNVLYPQAYYDKYGGKKPDISDAVVSEKNAASSGSTIKGYTENGESYTTDNIDKSLISRRVTVSSYVGMSLSSAISSINDSGLYIQSIEYDGENVPKNEVLKQSVKAGTKVKYGTGIVLKVSGTPANITVPKLVGLTLEKAEKTATKAGMTLSIVRMASSKKNNIVLMQSEKPKTVTENRSLVIYVSNGRNRVPTVKNLKTAEAVERLNDAGFKSKVVYIETSSPSQVGIVGGQSLEADSFQNVGKTVKIYVGKKPSKKSSSKASSSKNTASKATSSKKAASSAPNTSSKASSAAKTESKKPTTSASQISSGGSSQSGSSTKTESGLNSSAEASAKTESGGTSAE